MRNYFNPDRATSGPMAFFTDNKEIAENYSRDKSDTSLAYEEEYDSYETQFRVNGKSTMMIKKILHGKHSLMNVRL